ncbi:MAG: hypothetical protein H6741_21620 [Alphaproteobacteria bacterium]|nr:hypothetical protein [Alphaproteobacteria bacterium]MCB9795311.1 hypothetical protein [Alphaproteobacteria bacterium]
MRPWTLAALLLLSCTSKDDASVQESGLDCPAGDPACADSPVDSEPVGDDSAADDSSADDSAADDSSAPTDADGDGVAADADCDDSDASVYPGAPEDCDGVDDDCDAAVDEGLLTTYYEDADGDGHGDPASGLEACEAPEGTVTLGDDCDDSDPQRFPEADGTCAQGTSCASILAADPASPDGVYLVDTDGSGQGYDPLSVYCDMTGGGWMLIGRQAPAEQLTKTADDIGLDESWDADDTHRWGNARIATLSPSTAYRITSTSAADGSGVDDAYFSPACVIDWEAYVGTWQGLRTDHYDDCGIAYSDEALTTAISAHTDNNCSLGIGQNNSGQYCSMRMGSCNCFNEGCASTWAAEEGVAAPCQFQDWESVVMSLWVK